MPDHPFSQSLAKQRSFFLRTVSCFRPEHAAFVPAPGMFSVASQIAHTAQVVDWFLEGAFSPKGFNLDFSTHEAAARAVTSLDAALALFTGSYGAAIAKFDGLSMADLHQPIAPGPIMGGAPRLAVVDGMGDHTAHHRGALATYARLLGLVPPMPYA